MSLWRCLSLLSVCMGLLACAGQSPRGGYLAGDGPGVPIDGSDIPEVVPRNEPRSAYGNPESYVVLGKRYRVLQSGHGYVAQGTASWYGRKFHGKRTSSGEPFNMYAMTAAHKTLPLPTYVEVLNRDTGQKIVVKVNDRGPFHDDRLIDLSYGAAAKLGILAKGTGRVEIRALDAGQPIPQSSSPVSSVAKSGELYVQFGAFQHRANAEQLRAQIAGADVRGASVRPGKDAAGNPVYRVWVGPLDDGEAVQTVVAKLAGVGIKSYQVVSD